MKGYLIAIAAMIFAIGLGAQTVLTCHDVQYTTEASGNSPYMNQTITVQGIVTFIKPNSALYISDPDGGPWSGLYIYHRNTSNAVTIGDMVKLNGSITEYNGLTEMGTVNTYEILSSGNAVPAPAQISTADLPRTGIISEQWEGVLVRFTDVQIKSAVDSYGQFLVADSSNAQAMVDDGLYAIPATSIVMGDQWYLIQGIVDQLNYSSAGYKVNPRNANDLIKQDSIENSTIKVLPTDINASPILNEITSLNLVSTKVKSEWGVMSYTVKLKIDPSKVHFEGLNIAGSVTQELPDYTVSTAGDTLSWTVLFQDGLIANQESVVLIKMLVRPIVYGEATIDLLSFKYNNTAVNNLVDGVLLTKLQEKIAYLNIGKTGDKKNIFNPSLNEHIMITYGVKTGYLAKAVIRIYDSQGRLVFTPVHSNSFPSSGFSTYEWNGRDANLNLLPPGLYYCHLEVTDRTNGDSDRTVQPIVIKAALK